MNESEELEVKLRASGVSNRTLATYLDAWRKFENSPFYADADINGFLAEHAAKARATLRLYRAALVACMRTLGKRAEAEKVRGNGGRVVKSLSSDEVAALLACARSAVPSERALALVELMLHAGLRASEALSLTWADIDWNRSVARVLGKGDRERFVPTAKCGSLASWRDIGGDTTLVFEGWSYAAVKQMFWRWSQTTGINFHPHRLRHTAATNMIRAGVALPVVQAILGHSKIQTTARYLHLTTEDIVSAYMEKMA